MLPYITAARQAGATSLRQIAATLNAREVDGNEVVAYITGVKGAEARTPGNVLTGSGRLTFNVLPPASPLLFRPKPRAVGRSGHSACTRAGPLGGVVDAE